VSKDHPANPHTNRYPSTCCICRQRVGSGEGFMEKIMGTTRGWRVYHLACDQAAHPEDYKHWDKS
jgi:hypothetical protein